MHHSERRDERTYSAVIAQYVATERRRTRLRLMTIAAALFCAGLCLLPLAALMTDIGHAVGVASMSLVICSGAAVVAYKARRAGNDSPR